ncbi:Rieske 2Fe-2S domain-containing protein [Gordonia pseudamarae]|uniref:Rieske 2Fe-2S domain-containing protein n=1 Tax=Gordonia pseudamarae TaxID=2831662 RepID=A0ABX6IN26_9ACTN|nr:MULTISPECIES: MBL fold metallo-hydrolase [Gordonia]MBD0024263.1 Rieske 2Fe-2S domain-containing protein [Gordonia sp. (in: high G+C Gram-positive bacteria)]QHN28289.1 Rieske 2Fe-2S domain-containing protein [Gordonia pseudamarae]QHN37157.1 Rieske 2Fe-2S domain-containing protein [Gordonia pseudamarae]
MKITSIGHAGFHIETAAGSILCDPWVNPAYFASWIPFPDNSELDWKALGRCDYLYVSHLHRDHFDEVNLRDNVDKDTTVLLPDYPVPDLKRELERLGFHKFVETTDSVKTTVTGDKGSLDIMIIALRAPADGPIGDSGLIVSDGETVCFNMNDARPVDLDVIDEAFGHVDVHLLQYSGAIWYPMVYDIPRKSKANFAAQKRQRGMDRARSYIEQVGATWVVPSAGPPMFLDEELYAVNDLGSGIADDMIGDLDVAPGTNPVPGDVTSIFPDQVTFLEQMRIHGTDDGVRHRGLMMVSGSAADFTGSTLESIEHPYPPEDVFGPNKKAYLERMQAKFAPIIAAEKATWAPAEGDELLPALRELFEPIMAQSDLICDGIGYPVGLVMTPHSSAKEVTDETEIVVLDFPNRIVREPKEGEGKYRYGFRIATEIVRTVLRDNEPDWVNTIFLSTRFTTWRIGGYNEYLYTFFKCLTDERIAYADGWFSEAHDDDASIRKDGWEIQRRCPHLKADLDKFGVVDGDTLTCNLHGWEWNLPTGRCLTTKGHDLRAEKL